MTFEQAWQAIAASGRILMTTHVKPDGDGLGVLSALLEALSALGKEASVVLPSGMAPRYGFLHGADRFQVLGRDVTLEALEGPWDLILIVDTCTWQQLAGLEPLVRRSAGRVLAIDHHPTRDDLEHEELVDTEAAATGAIAMGLLNAAEVAITPTMAEALFVSLASDTGWFRFPNTTPEVFRLAAQLAECGAAPQMIYERLYQGDTPARVRLLAEALPTMTLNWEGDVACFWISAEMFRRSGARLWDTENMINESQRIAGVVVSVMLTETDDGTIRASLRSKHDVDVAAIAMGFGGGGHARAAGCTLSGPLEAAREAVLDAVERAMGRTRSGAAGRRE